MPFEDVPDAVRKRMARNRKTGSKPEVKVRSIAHRLGFRFRKNHHDLPGTPDVVFPSRRKAIFVHGCFWHQHEGCRHASVPQVRSEYWLPKLRRTKERDAAALVALQERGWETLVIWECDLSDESTTAARLVEFLRADLT